MDVDSDRMQESIDQAASIIDQAAPIIDNLQSQNLESVVGSHTELFNPMPAILTERENDDLFLVGAAALNTQLLNNRYFVEWLARAMMLVACALYGTNFGTVKYLQDSIPTSALCSIRFILATLGALPLLWLSKEPIPKEAFLGGLEVGLYLSLAFIGQGLGLEEMAASKSAFICSLAVVFVPIYENISGKKTPIITWITAVLALVGVIILQGGAVTNFTMSDFETLLQPVMFGLGFWRVESLMGKYPSSAAAITLAQLLMVATLTTAWSFAAGTFPDLQTLGSFISDGDITKGLLWVSLVTTVLTIFMETFAMKYLKATETSLIFTTEPLFGAAFAAYLLGENIDSHIWTGGAVIVFSCLLSPIINSLKKEDKVKQG